MEKCPLCGRSNENFLEPHNASAIKSVTAKFEPTCNTRKKIIEHHM